MAGYINTSARVDWNTPAELVALVRKAFQGTIELDPCSNADSIVGAASSVSLPADGLSLSWAPRKTFVNPPFGRVLRRWALKCAEEAKAGGEVILLSPANVGTVLWQDVIFKEAAAICFLKGRLTFLGADEVAPMPCALSYFGEDPTLFMEVFQRSGFLVRAP